MKKLIMLAAMLFAVSAHAAVEVNTNGLTDTQKATLVQQAEQMRQEVVGAGNVADTVDKWVNIGERFGKMFGGAAKEIGMAANEFLMTPVGMMTAGVIVFNYVGGPIIHVTIGLLLLFVGFGILFYVGRSSSRMKYTYDLTRWTWWGTHPVTSKERDELGDSAVIALLVGYGAVLVVSIWTIFAW